MVFGSGVTWERFHAVGKVEEFKDKFRRSRIGKNVTGRLSSIRRRVMSSGPAAFVEHFISALSRTGGVIWEK